MQVTEEERDKWSADLQYLSHDPHKADIQKMPALPYDVVYYSPE